MGSCTGSRHGMLLQPKLTMHTAPVQKMTSLLLRRTGVTGLFLEPEQELVCKQLSV